MALSGTRFFNDSRLVSYYPFDTNSNDNKGSNNGSDTSISYVAGKFSNAASIGNASTIIMAAPSFLNNTQGTLCFWIKKGATGQGPIIWDLYDSADQTGNRLYSEHRGDTSDKITYVQRDASATVLSATADTTTFDDTNWHHIAYTSDGSTFKIYVDGTLQSLTVGAGSNTGQWFGSITSRNNFAFEASDGIAGHLIDDAAIFNAALTAQEISDIYNDVQAGGGASFLFNLV